MTLDEGVEYLHGVEFFPDEFGEGQLGNVVFVILFRGLLAHCVRADISGLPFIQ